MTTTGTQPDQPTIYHIRVKGRLEPRWNDWFEGMTVTPETNGDTLLSGQIVDQAALHGVLTKIRDLALPLVSVMEVNTTQAGGLDIHDADAHRHRSNKETNA
jgi:hypothetical protein